MSNNSTKTSDNVEKHFFRASAADFKKIPGRPITYWLSQKAFTLFTSNKLLLDVSRPKVGLNTTDNNQFLRLWYEVNINNTGLNFGSRYLAIESNKQWFPYNKGGGFRRWYGNHEYFVNWRNDGEDLKTAIANDPKKQAGGRVVNEDCYFKSSISWSLAGAKIFSVRVSPVGFIFDVGGSSIFPTEDEKLSLAGFLSSTVANYLMGAMNPTFNFQAGNVAALPIVPTKNERVRIESIARCSIDAHKIDWDSFETSWEFSILPILLPEYKQSTLKATYNQIRTDWREMTLKIQQMEEENNRIFIDAYALQDELDEEVYLNEITLTCNPYYRYGANKKEEELETLLLADTLKEFISYAVGCMFGRYSLDKPGLILANQGETISDYLKQIPEPVFSADDDNVIPMLDGDWFTDDVTERFGQFLKVTFGDAHYEENLKFIEQALGKDIRKYFLKDFYTDHLKRYKKRPIYWLFSSPKGTFNALIYMHRYRPDTVSVVLNDYLREFRIKLSAHKNHLEAVSISSNASAGEKTKALKDIENHRKMIDELDVYEREVLYPLATEQIEIDLDDGVKVNYQKFGEALKKIPGLAAKED